MLKTLDLASKLLYNVVVGIFYLDQLWVDLEGLGGIGNGISVCFCLDVCLVTRQLVKLQPGV